MSDTHASITRFHLTGERLGGDLADIGRLGLRPALFSAYQDLSRLRYDYPLVLAKGDVDGAFVRSLTDIIDDLLRKIAPRGIEGERLRKRVLGLEEEIRTLVQQGTEGSLSELWDLASSNRLTQAGGSARQSLGDDLSLARAALPLDGVVVDCDDETPTRILTHAWSIVQQGKARQFFDEVNELVVKLSNILEADSKRSKPAFDADALKRSVGSAFEAAFDFETMSDVLAPALQDGAIPEKRRRRIRAVLTILNAQDFFDPPCQGANKGRRKRPPAFVFDHCTNALDAFRVRLPKMVEFVKAMTIARLEIENRYKESTHDRLFQRFDESFLGPDDLAFFPSYLVCLRNGAVAAAEKAMVAEILSSGLPIKILAQQDDILAESPIASGRLALGVRGSQLAAMAVGLGSAFVLQSGAAVLYRMRESVLRGLTNNDPALFSIFSGCTGTASQTSGNAPKTPPYLIAAAASESRAFPTFVYDPAGGSDWATRFSLAGNAQAESEWPVHLFRYEDEELQVMSGDIAFTFVDFAAADERYAESFADIPRSKWDDAMVPVTAFLDLDDKGAAETFPYILMVDERNVLHKVIVENRLVEAAIRCREMWRNLQELGGINNSHAKALLAREKAIWERNEKPEPVAPKPGPAPEPATDGADAAPTPSQAAAPEAETTGEAATATPEAADEAAAPTDEPYIETPRCTTCDECTQINNRMFAYDDNKQAYIADPDAGTYRQLVEAAESCQVAIIHPGKPRNQDEPNLDELMARAEPFN